LKTGRHPPAHAPTRSIANSEVHGGANARTHPRAAVRGRNRECHAIPRTTRISREHNALARFLILWSLRAVSGCADTQETTMRWLVRAMMGLGLMIAVARGVLLFGEDLLDSAAVTASTDAPRAFH
jgi:hypothetical protein